MPDFGFPAQPQMSRMSRMVANMRRDAGDAQVAAVTGRPADLAASLDGRVNEAVLMGKSLADYESYAEAIALAEARTDTIQQRLDHISASGQSLANSVDTLLTNGTADNFTIVSEEGQQLLEGIVSALNSSFAGRSLFGGDLGVGSAISDTDTIMAGALPILSAGTSASAAYSALEAAFIAPGGFFDTTVYTGGTGNSPRTEVAAGEVVETTVRADEEPIRRMLLNTAVVSAAYDLSNGIPDFLRRDLIELGSIGLRNAVDGVIGLQGRLGAAEERIATVKARNIAEEATMTVRFNEFTGADQYTEALRLSEIEAHLEAAFSITARLSRMSLANYL